MLTVAPFLIAVAVVAVCALIGWIRWLKFNLEVYERAQTTKVFELTPQVARSFLQSIRRPVRDSGQVSEDQLVERGAQPALGDQEVRRSSAE